jgi:hypothetical protein
MLIRAKNIGKEPAVKTSPPAPLPHGEGGSIVQFGREESEDGHRALKDEGDEKMRYENELFRPKGGWSI